MQPKSALDDALALMRDLRARCDWDAAQTHESLRPYLLEEAHEVDEAIRSGDDESLREELGDLCSRCCSTRCWPRKSAHSARMTSANTLVAKMRGRHPHLYGDGVKEPWERMKANRVRSIVEVFRSGSPRCIAPIACRSAPPACTSIGPTRRAAREGRGRAG